eukprot:2752713-Amphidinium_carterae.1
MPSVALHIHPVTAPRDLQLPWTTVGLHLFNTYVLHHVTQQATLPTLPAAPFAHVPSQKPEFITK